jgi:hypothetical protein
MTETSETNGALRRAGRRSLSALMLGALASCTLNTAPADALRLEQPDPAPGASALRVGRTHFYGNPVVIDVPPSATSGTPFAVAVTTYGGGCTGEDRSVVLVTDLRADVVPYQRVYRPRADEACTEELRITRREVAVTFQATGQAVVRVHGRAMPGDSLVVVERVVTVR